MTISLKNVQLRTTHVRTRMPFRYGIATLEMAPYLVVFGEFEINGESSTGISADILPPKWFTKQPEASLDDEIDEMMDVVRCACVHATKIPEQPSVFDWWRELYEAQMSDSDLNHCPPLLKGLGTSLLERAAIDAFCRHHRCPFAQLLRENRFQIRLGDLHPELSDLEPMDLLPSEPRRFVSARHTVGLADPLSSGEIESADRLDDGLPQTLDQCIEYYGLTHFKIKLPADIDTARDRLRAIARTLSEHCQSYAFTLDGNEFFTTPSAFRDYWQELSSDPSVYEFIQHGLLLVEQPLHRDVALSDEVGSVWDAWKHRPPMIIDESDGEIGSFPRALEIGYDGTSHKNCKGVFKGIANACLVRFRNQAKPLRPLTLTGEDLMNLGPIALLQDLAVSAVLGIKHIERNGHHYVAGLQPFTQAIQDATLTHHCDLYCPHHSPSGKTWPRLNITDGRIDLESVNQAPFGYAMYPLTTDFDRVADV
ncbi:hypothetical protein CA13_57180 [Planctomycetes bacterium CA13]|uniref:Enolase C-terminal domain-containing protein n=1 Tax=Novipirellula herctigrandis TaxID=2527986 RepID=A0A5C5ZA88_9BACT|nr:hypothetical protein CA13_57180 [Planctomycetes bacterium CA13]